MTRDDALWEADEVRQGRLNLNQCDYPEEVEDELGPMNFDSYGNYRRPTPDWDNMNHNQNHDPHEDDKEFYKCCCGLFLLLLLFSIFISIGPKTL